MNWLHSSFPTSVAGRRARPINDFADSEELMTQAYVMEETILPDLFVLKIYEPRIVGLGNFEANSYLLLCFGSYRDWIR
jgi:hypothetical protein